MEPIWSDDLNLGQENRPPYHFSESLREDGQREPEPKGSDRENRFLTSGENTNSAFRVASVTAKRVLMDVEKRALTDG